MIACLCLSRQMRFTLVDTCLMHMIRKHNRVLRGDAAVFALRVFAERRPFSSAGCRARTLAQAASRARATEGLLFY